MMNEKITFYDTFTTCCKCCAPTAQKSNYISPRSPEFFKQKSFGFVCFSSLLLLLFWTKYQHDSRKKTLLLRNIYTSPLYCQASLCGRSSVCSLGFVSGLVNQRPLSEQLLAEGSTLNRPCVTCHSCFLSALMTSSSLRCFVSLCPSSTQTVDL